ncbi:MAG: hypothetical protein R2794_06785 [Chitinophagales bacterium]
MKNNKIRMMYLGSVIIGILSSCSASKNSAMNNMVARMEVKEPIEGVCDNANVFAILPIPGNGQVKAKPPKTNEEIAQELNATVSFLKDKPDYEDKGMVNLIVNCEGELVRCEIDNKTKSPELDSQIVAVFAELKTWTAGKINNNYVDTSVLYSFTIKNGIIYLN